MTVLDDLTTGGAGQKTGTNGLVIQAMKARRHYFESSTELAGVSRPKPGQGSGG